MTAGMTVVVFVTLELVPFKGLKLFVATPTWARLRYLLGVIFKICNEHPNHFIYGNPPSPGHVSIDYS